VAPRRIEKFSRDAGIDPAELPPWLKLAKTQLEYAKAGAE